MSSNIHVIAKNDNFQIRVNAALIDLALTISQEEKPLLFSSTWKARNQFAQAVIQNKIDIPFYTMLILSDTIILDKAESNMHDPGAGVTNQEIRDWFSDRWTTIGLNDSYEDVE